MPKKINRTDANATKTTGKSRVIYPVLIGIIVLLIAAIIIIGVKNSKKIKELEKKQSEEIAENTYTVTPTLSLLPTASVSPTPGVSGIVTPTESIEPTEISSPTAMPSSAPTESVVPTKAVTPKNPFADHGKLQLNGTKIVDKNGNPFQLKGVSTHGLQWYPEYVNKETFKMIRDEWNANVVRLALYTDENGYCTCSDAEKAKLLQTVKNGIDYAKELGLYVIVDWHILHDLTPMKYIEESKKFFTEIGKEYGSYENIIYEICNEPNGGTSWEEIKNYASTMIPLIRSYSPDALIIVGTPTWSQDVDVAAKSPIAGTNIMYALHFYAGTHKDNLRQKLSDAIKAGLPVFVSEFGITDASGNGRCDIDEANKWIALLDSYQISYVCWNLANKNESSCLIRANVKKLYGFTDEELSTEALWLLSVLDGNIPLTDEEKEKILKDSEQGTAGGDPGAPAGFSYNVTVNGCKISLLSVNTWMEGSKYCYQMDLIIKNSSGASMNTWGINLTGNCNITCSDFWNSSIKASGNSLAISPASYNRSIANGGEVSGIGFIVKCDAPLKIESSLLTK